ncbi:Panacea domain-containing protein [Leptospira weilii]|uniref:Panacea domain-containing protein n=1 Tax=Leptospira weilii TaxID=28184 RepID=UPI001EF267A1|nr:Panacea domain-containing protein [Leptospira weilii]ULH29550.1 SocA family protein [Leptospira weilii]
MSFKEKAGRPISQTFLYKLLAYVDFTSLKKYDIPTLGLKYVAMDRGPVPIEIYNEIKEQNKFITFEVIDKKTETYSMKLIEPLIKADLDYFNQDDVDMMRSIINEHVSDSSKA